MIALIGGSRSWVAVAACASALVVGCSSGVSYAEIEGAGGSVDAPRGTVAVRVTLGDKECDGPERECAEISAVEALLFTGVPGTSLPRAMVRNEGQARQAHADYFERLLEGGEHGRYVVRSLGPEGDAFTIVVNQAALRRSLEDEGVIRRFGR
ncbi:MAG: hypothetical protein R3304_07980 [Longimicrobiales bacterium]|nr:hypothetical protein [Longimicrobiales bacterium]